MTDRDIWTYGPLIGGALGDIGGIIGVAIMFKRRMKERREKAERGNGRLAIPPAAPALDPRDWHGAPASKPR